MVRSHLKRIGAGVLLVALASCQSPEERVAELTAEGEALLEEGRVGRARAAFRKSLQIDPDYAPAFAGLAESFIEKEQMSRALSAYSAAVRYAPDDVGYKNPLARLFLNSGDPESAKTLLDEVLEKESDNAQAKALMGAFFLQLDDTALALQYAQEALDLSGGFNADALVVFAGERVKADRRMEAIPILDRGLQSDPQNKILLSLKMAILEQEGRPDLQIEVYNELIKAYPDRAEYRRNMALAAIRAEQYDVAREIFEAQLEADREDADRYLDLVRLENTINGQQAAKQMLVGFVSERPDLFDLAYALATYLTAERDFNAGTQLLRRMVNADFPTSDRVKAAVFLASTLLQQGKVSEGRSVINMALELDERNEQAVVLAARFAADERRYDDATAQLRVILVDNPYSQLANAELGRVFELQGREDLAREQYAQAWQASDSAAAIARPYVSFLRRVGDIDLADRVVERALRKNPADSVLLRHRVDIKMEKEEWALAREAAILLGRTNVPDSVADQALDDIRRREGRAVQVFTDVGTVDGESRTLAHLVRSYVESDRQEAALDLLEEILVNAPDNVVAKTLKAQVKVSMGEKDEARSLYLEAVIAAPGDFFPLKSAIDFFVREQEFRQAQSLLTTAANEATDLASVLYLQAEFYRTRGDMSAAIRAYEDLVERFPNSTAGANNLAVLLLDERTDTASFERALALSERFKGSQFALLRDTYAWALVRTGSIDEGLFILEELVRQLHRNAAVRYHLAMAHVLNGDTARGLDILRVARDLAQASDNPVLRKIDEQIAQLTNNA